MFRKLVSNLSFSPALVGQLGFYAKRLKKEEVTRRAGLILTALALVVQSFAVFSPPESANAANSSDMIYGGVTTTDDVLRSYDNSATDYKKIMDYAGVTRAELANLKSGTINSKEYGTGSGTWLTWGRSSRFSEAQGQVTHDINGTIVYSKPLWLYDTLAYTIKYGSTYDALVGYSAKIGNFAIMKNCGNIITRVLPTPPPKISYVTVCRPGTGVITINESERLATDQPSNSTGCQPASACNLAVVDKIDRTHIVITAHTAIDRGATLSGYTFTIKKNDSNGAVIKEIKQDTTNIDYSTQSIELAAAGTYYVSVVAHTSLGDRTSTACAQTFEIAPPEKCAYNPDLVKTSSECQPCPGNTSLWYKDSDCTEKILSTKTATNLTQGNSLATTTLAAAADRIEYKLTVENIGKTVATATFKEDLGDVLEYATIQDNGGGVYDQTAKVLSWSDVVLKPGEKQSRSFTVSMLGTIPTMPRGQSEPSSYDCVMNNVFGNNIQIKVDCPTPKVVEQTVSQLPKTGPTENMLFAGVLLSVVTFFYARSKQLGKEVKLIRKDFSTGTI